MCLNISNHIKSSKKIQNGFLVAYKIVNKDNSNIFQCALGTGFFVGENYSSRTSVDITNDEKEYGRIDFGFHLLLVRDAARKLNRSLNSITSWNLRSISRQTKIIKVYYRPEDVVSYGIFTSHNINFLTKSVVVTKMTIKSLNNVR